MANIGQLTVVIDGETFKLEKALKKARRGVSKFEKKQRGAMKKFKQNILSARSAVIALGAVVALIGGKIFGNTVSEAIKFETALGKVNTLVRDSDTVFGSWATQMRRMSVEFGQSKEELAQGMFDIVSATVPVNEAMQTLETSAKLAQGGFTSTAQATKAMVVTWNTYRDELDSVSDAADFLFAVQERGILTLQDVAKNIGTIAASAKASGVSLNDLGYSFSAISRSGVGAEKTVVQMQQMFDVFTKASSREATIAASQLGVALDKTSISSDNLKATIEKLSHGSIYQLKQIFREKRGFRGVAAMINELSKAEKDLAVQRNRQGMAEHAAEERQKLFGARLDKVKQQVKNLKEAIGIGLLQAMDKHLEKLIEWQKAWENNGGMQQAIDMTRTTAIVLAGLVKDAMLPFIAAYKILQFMEDHLTLDGMINDLNIAIAAGSKFLGIETEIVKAQKEARAMLAYPTTTYDHLGLDAEHALSKYNEAIKRAKVFFLTSEEQAEKMRLAKKAAEIQAALDRDGARQKNASLYQKFLADQKKQGQTVFEQEIYQNQLLLAEYKQLYISKAITREEYEKFAVESEKRIRVTSSKTYQIMKSNITSFANSFGDSLTDLAMGAEVSFTEMAESFKRMIMKMIIQISIIQPMMEALFGAQAGGGGKGVGIIGSLVNAAAGIFSPTTPTVVAPGASGGFDPAGIVGSGSFVGPMQPAGFAEGGVATKPTAGVFGEAGAEALIPLDRFPEFQGGGGNTNVEVNVIGVPEGTKTEESRDSNGMRKIDVILDEKVANNIRTGTKTFSALTKTFSNLNTQLTGR